MSLWHRGHMAVHEPGSHPQNIIWSEAKRSQYGQSVYGYVGLEHSS